MPERGNDRLESFFKKVAGRPDISFNEEDWKKLESRLEANDAHLSVARKKRNRLMGASIVAILLMSSIYLINTSSVMPSKPMGKNETSDKSLTPERGLSTGTPASLESSPPITADNKDRRLNDESALKVENIEKKGRDNNRKLLAAPASISRAEVFTDLNKDELNSKLTMQNASPLETHQIENLNADKTHVEQSDHALIIEVQPIQEVNNSIVESTKNSPAIADKVKQKANMVDSVEREKNDVKVIDAYGSGLTEHPASPRLSLLLSVAPDFSTVGFEYYSDPGESLGLNVHYHIKDSWSISTGVIKTRKKYTGDGEDYQPPKGYWKYYTNGVVPETIDGTCNVLEIPLMVQYTIVQKGKSRFLVAAGASSYVMLNESYRYNFEQPNPGAKEGWSSEKRSALLFNMINVTAGFEHQILPGFMLGLEPYIRIPVKGIGWSDLKLYTAGASVTLRYIMLKKKNPLLPAQSRGTD